VSVKFISIIVLKNLLITVNGNWGEWSDFSVCSTSCGYGTKTKQRKCNDPSPAFGGVDCKGNGIANKACNIIPCPGI